MFRKYFSLLFFIGLFAVGSVSVFAQKTVGGKVEFEDAKGKKTPYKAAKVDCYRVDVTEKCGSTVSDESGKFSFENIPNKAVLVFAVSGSGIGPGVTPDIRLDESNSLTVSKGDGAVLSEADVREVAINYAKGEGKLTDAQKAQLAEIEKKAAEREARNAKVKDNNRRRGELIKEGNAAFNKKDYDLAVKLFEEGYQLDPEFAGSAPVFLNNKAQSLKARAIDSFNAGAKSGDKALKEKGKKVMVADFTSALEAVSTAFSMAKNAKPGAGSNSSKRKEDMKLSVSIAKELFRIFGQVNLNFATYVATEEQATKAVSLYKSSLEMLPKNADVIAGLAMALYSSGDFKGSKAEKKESLDYWNQFKKIAPKDHKQHIVADDMISFLKDEVK